MCVNVSTNTSSADRNAPPRLLEVTWALGHPGASSGILGISSGIFGSPSGIFRASSRIFGAPSGYSRGVLGHPRDILGASSGLFRPPRATSEHPRASSGRQRESAFAERLRGTQTLQTRECACVAFVSSFNLPTLKTPFFLSLMPRWPGNAAPSSPRPGSPGSRAQRGGGWF